jgi:hypothetical protein
MWFMSDLNRAVVRCLRRTILSFWPSGLGPAREECGAPLTVEYYITRYIYYLLTRIQSLRLVFMQYVASSIKGPSPVI